APETPAQHDAGADQQPGEKRAERSGVHVPSRVRQVQIHREQRFAEIKPERAPGQREPFQKGCRRERFAGQRLKFLEPHGHQTERQRQREVWTRVREVAPRQSSRCHVATASNTTGSITVEVLLNSASTKASNESAYQSAAEWLRGFAGGSFRYRAEAS